MLKQDDDTASMAAGKSGMRPSESAFIVFCIGIVYPWLRLFWPRIKGVLGGGLTLLAGCGLAYFAYWIDNFTVGGFDFRDIIRKSQIPFMRVFLSLALAWLAYLLMQRSVWLLSRIYVLVSAGV